MAGSKRAEEAVPGDYCVARRTFAYTDDLPLDRGQVFRLTGQLNDEKLIRLGYVDPVGQKPKTTYPCRVCGKEFVEMGLRDGHGKARHEDETALQRVLVAPERDPAESDDEFQNRLDDHAREAGLMADAAEADRVAQEDRVAPLYMDKTSASRT
jgi:hypothetical protein